jgi:hypothetical protein
LNVSSVWQDGAVIAVWDKGNPYQIYFQSLVDGEEVEVKFLSKFHVGGPTSLQFTDFCV